MTRKSYHWTDQDYRLISLHGTTPSNQNNNDNKALVDTDAEEGGGAESEGKGSPVHHPLQPSRTTYTSSGVLVYNQLISAVQWPRGDSVCPGSEWAWMCNSNKNTRVCFPEDCLMRFGTLWFYIIGLNWSQCSQCPAVSWIHAEDCRSLLLQSTCAKKVLIWWMLWTWSVHFKPLIDAAFVIDAEARQASDGVSLCQILQADCTFSGILRQDVLIIRHSGLG